MRPIWKQPYRDEFLERAGLYLLYAFILSICANPFIVLFFADRDALNYVKVETEGHYQGYVPIPLPGQNLSTLYPDADFQTRDILSRYKIVDQEFIDRQHEFEERISWIIITALLGWCCTSPRFQRGWPKLVATIKKYFPDETTREEPK